MRIVLLVAIAGCASTPHLATSSREPAGWWTRSDACPDGAKLDGSIQTGWIGCVVAGERAPGNLEAPPPNGLAQHGDPYGRKTVFWQNGKVLVDGSHDLSSLEVGTWSYYFDDGTLFARGNYHGGFADHDWVYYGPDGKPAFFAPGGAGCPDGTSLHREDLVPPSIEAWCAKPDGTREGPYATWRGDLAGWSFGTFAGGERTGTWMRWTAMREKLEHHYVAGKVASETVWSASTRRTYTEQGPTGEEGVYREWRDDGSLAIEGENHGNCRHGRWRYYDPNGVLVSTAQFDHCKLVSRVDAWHCMTAAQLLGPADLPGHRVRVEHVAGEPEDDGTSSTRLVGDDGTDVAVRLYKWDFDQGGSQFVYALDVLRGSRPFTDEELAHADEIGDRSERVVMDGRGVLVLDQILGATALVTCKQCNSHDEVLPLAKLALHRIRTDRSCQR